MWRHLCVLLALSLIPTPQQVPNANRQFHLVTPALAVQGETFSGMVVETTPNGFAAPPEGTSFAFKDRTVTLGPNGRLEIPPFSNGFGNRFVEGSLVIGDQRIPVRSHVEIVKCPSGIPTKLAESTSVCSGNGSFRVRGQGLQGLKNPRLRSPGFQDVPLTEACGSSLEQIYLPSPGTKIGVGTWSFSADDASGKRLDCPTKSVAPRVRVDGSDITQRGQRGTFTLNTNVDTGVILIGGEEKIALDRRTAFTRKSAPAQVGFTALGLGLYEMSARPISEEDVVPPADQPTVDAICGKPTSSFDEATQLTEVNTPVRIIQQDGKPCGNSVAHGAVTYPEGIAYGTVACDASGNGNLRIQLPGKVAAAAVQACVYRVQGYVWNPEKKDPNSVSDPVEINDEPLHHCQGHRMAIVIGKGSNRDINGAASWILNQTNIQHKIWFFVQDGRDPSFLSAKTAPSSGGNWSEASTKVEDIAKTFSDCCYWDEILVISHGSQAHLWDCLQRNLPILVDARPVRKVVLWICKSSEDIYPGNGNRQYQFEQLAYILRPRNCPCGCNHENCIAYNSDNRRDARKCPTESDNVSLIAGASYSDPALVGKGLERPSKLGITDGTPFHFLSPDGRVLESTITKNNDAHPAQKKTAAGTTPEPSVTTSGAYSDAPAAGADGIEIFGGTHVRADPGLKGNKDSMNPDWRRRPGVAHRPRNYRESYHGPLVEKVCKHPTREGCIPRSALPGDGE